MTQHPWSDWSDPTRSLPITDHVARQATLQASLSGLVPEGHTAALLVTNPANVRWASGFTGSNGQLVVLPDRCVLVTDARYTGRAAVECPGLEVAIARPLTPHAVSLAEAAGVDRLVFEGEHMSYAEATAVLALVGSLSFADAVSAHGVVEAQRVVKDDAELARLARACSVTEAALMAVFEDGLVGRTEHDIALHVEDAIRQAGAEVGFATIVAAGINGAVPHHEPTRHVVGAGELVTIDCGARVEGYHADTTRTVAAGRLPADGSGLAEVFALVAAAQQRGVEAVTVGAEASDVDLACRDVIGAAGYAAAFVHGTGHGVGLEIHEAPAVAATSAATLRARTALTVEPGVYLPGRGGVRIEDTVVVADAGPAWRLTDSPRTLLVI